MIVAKTCLICGNRELKRIEARLTPFLEQRCRLAPEPGMLAQLWCPACDFAFFNHRLTEDEVAVLYKDYREEEYDNLRLTLEPGYAWYQDLFADKGNLYHRERVEQLVGFFAGIPKRFKKVLDYGGGKDGWLAKSCFQDSSVGVFDLSDGSRKLDSQSDCDLVLCAHTLEHVSFPVPFLKDLHRRIPAHCCLYLELPIEYQGSLRQSFHAGQLCAMHEHLSHFTPGALVRLLNRTGFKTLHVGTLDYRSYNGQSIAILAEKMPRICGLFWRERCNPSTLPPSLEQRRSPVRRLRDWLRNLDRRQRRWFRTRR